jgi:hypothetical protein
VKTIIDEIDQGFDCAKMNFEDDLWRKSIPAEAGWYLIKTNTPIVVLKSVGQPKPENKAHINIPKAISMWQNLGIAISQSNDEDYVVYNGEARNLKARAREHMRGHRKTYCLGLSNYEALRNYNWTFCYMAISKCKALPSGDKPFGIMFEQAWRAKHGWPILCSR